MGIEQTCKASHTRQNKRTTLNHVPGGQKIEAVAQVSVCLAHGMKSWIPNVSLQMKMLDCSPSTQEVEAEKPEVQDHPLLRNRFKASLGGLHETR